MSNASKGPFPAPGCAATPQSGAVPLPEAIDHYFELALYLLVLTGFGTLASTGGIDWPTVLLVGGALAVRGYLLAKRRRVDISERWTTPLTIAYFVFFAVDYFFFSRSFLPATVHLALFGVVVRMFSLRRERDHIMLAILAFLMVLASAVLTVDSVFLFCFAGIHADGGGHVCSDGDAALGTCRQASGAPFERSPGASSSGVLAGADRPGSDADDSGGRGRGFLRPAPHVGRIPGRVFVRQPIFPSGFSDHVQLGQIGRIQQSNAVVMHIQIDGDQRRPYESALARRGPGLFRRTNLVESRANSMACVAWATAVLPCPHLARAAAPNSLAQNISLARSRGITPSIHYRVLMEPIGTNVFFLAPWARSISGDYRALAVDAGGAVYDLDGQRAITRYEADSDIATPQASQLRAVAQNILAQFAQPYLHLPALDPRIPRLAAQIVGSAANNYDKAAALERYLRTHYGYTLQLPQSLEQDPLANFLFERKRGHCEYFASSMAVMLRTLGIPSRVVNGFRSAEFNDVTGNYVVRAKDAHAWVEVYFPGYGWQTFDPTPASSAGSPQGWGRAMLYLDAAASFWREWVIDYDSAHQYVLGQSALSGTRSLVERVRMWGRIRYAGMVNWTRRSQAHAERSPGSWLGAGAGAALLLLVLLNARRMARVLRGRWLRAHPDRSPDQAAAMWYERMACTLARRGVSKVETQTPQEFVRLIGNEALRVRVKQFTEAYESARFGNSADDARRLEALYQEVEAAARK